MSTVGIIFSNLNDSNVPELTMERTMGSVPFAGRYRLIDFVLSNMVNSGVTKVGVITKNNYQSLMDHLGSGKDWDLARKSGGLILLPPFGAKGADALYSSRLEALKGALGFISKSKEEFVILSDSDIVYNLDFNQMIAYHEEKGADITLLYNKGHLTYEQSKNAYVFHMNENGRLTDFEVNPHREGTENHFMKVIVMRRQFLLTLVGEAISHGKKEFFLDVIASGISSMRIFGYEYEGFYANIDSIQNYYSSSMDLLKKAERDALFNVPNRSIYTKVKDSPPTLYEDFATVRNSLIADGCIIEGEVENSIIFRGAKIGKGAKVKDCIIMQDNYIGEKCELTAVITDKNVIIHDKVVLSGHKSIPFYIRKNRIV